MDVIALHRAGFASAVAPLGTALTEFQLQELWRLGPEPILCFDGDAAGQRAAAPRPATGAAAAAAGPQSALCHPAVGRGSRLADPARRAARLSSRSSPRARPLAQMLWEIELGARPVDTPERRADLERRLMRETSR